MKRQSLLRLLFTMVVGFVATVSHAFSVDGLRFRDDAAAAEVKALQQQFQRLGDDRGADTPAQAAQLSGRITRVIGLLDLSRPAIPKAGVVCTEILGPWYSAGPALVDTNMAPVDARTRAARSLTTACLDTIRAHLMANKDVIVTGMLDWIAGWAAKESIGAPRGWCTGFGAQDNWWPLRSFYPDDLIAAVVAGCEARTGAVLTKVAEARIKAAIAVAERTDRTLEAMVAAKWLPMPQLGIGDPALARTITERYEATVAPIRQQVTDEIEDQVEQSYAGKVAVDGVVHKIRTVCREFWTKTLFSSPVDGARAVDRKCREAEQAFAQRGCKHALDRSNIEHLGWSKIMAVPRPDGSLEPVNFNGLVCAAAIDGFSVALSSSWLPFSAPTLTIRPATGGGAITVRLRKLTRENGVNLWLAEDAGSIASLSTAHDVMTCFQSTIDDTDAMTIAKTVGYVAASASGFGMGLSDFMGLVGGGISAAQCKAAKRGWLASAS